MKPNQNQRGVPIIGCKAFLNLFLLFILPLVINAQENNEWQKVIANDAINNDNFGKSVFIDGHYAIVGAWTDDDKGPEAGAAYLYSRTSEDDSWTFVQKLTASDAGAFNNFGSTVYIDNGRVLVGAPGNDSFAGAVYLFELEAGKNNWKEVEKIVASDRSKSDFFGSSLGMANQQIIVGAYGDDDFGSASGAAYLFEQKMNNQWIEQTKFTSKNIGPKDHFGISVAIDDRYIVIGVDGDNRVGSFFIYKQDEAQNWQSLLQIFASDGKMNDRFAHSVAISGDYIVAGADRSEDKVGAAYVFHKNLGGEDNWGEAQKLTPLDGSPGDRFGKRVAIDNDYLVVGSEHHQGKQGAAYVYKLNTEGIAYWEDFDKLIAYDRAANDLFGCSIALDGKDVIVGAFQQNGMGSGTGGIYLVELRSKPELASKEEDFRH